MKASDFFAQRGKPAPSHPVKVRLVDISGESQRFVEAEARMRFVPDRLHAEALDDAAAFLAKARTPPTDESRRSREQAHLLHTVLRDAAAPIEPFFDSPDQCATMLVPDERIRLLAEYQHWQQTHFPDSVAVEEFKAMVEDAETFTLPALLSKYGYWPIRRALTSLALAFGTSPTP